MGEIDIQWKATKSPEQAIRYILKYVTKSPALLPKGKRLFTASRGALEPVRKEQRDWIFHKIRWGHGQAFTDEVYHWVYDMEAKPPDEFRETWLLFVQLVAEGLADIPSQAPF